MKGILTMSQKEVDKISIIKQIISKELKVSEGSELLGLSQRQTYRILKKVKHEGTKGVIHKLRGRTSNHGYPEKIKKEVLRIYKGQYDDYGPTLFTEMLMEYHKIKVNHETVRRWLRNAAITTTMRKKRPHRKKRERRTCLGELLQFDGSYHDWFEGRGAECCLMNCVDDATGKIYLKFVISENTQDVLLTMWEYVKNNGIPRSLYTDKGAVYKAPGVLTDFGRAMSELDVEMIYANSAQAKGRVERGNRTHQDRLVKALRREGISNIAEANKYLLKSFIKKHNEKFSVNLEVPNVHRIADSYDLKNVFCYKTTRQLRNDYTINLSGGYIQLLAGKAPLPRPRQNVTICKWLNGELHIYFNDQELEYKILQEKPGKKGYIFHPAPKDHPWRRANEKLPGHRKFFAQQSGNSSRAKRPPSVT